MTLVEEEEPTFGINTASRMTGIPVDTLRMWERRYDAVMPKRSADNKRRYTSTDIARLRLFKNLVELGHSIGTVARLPIDALNERLQVHADMQTPFMVPIPDEESKTRVLIYGDELPFQVKAWTEALSMLDISGTHTIYTDFEKEALTQQPEVLVVQFPCLQSSTEAKLRELMQRTTVQLMVVVYTYAPSPVLDRLNQQGIVTLRTPITAENLEQACRSTATSDRERYSGLSRSEDDEPIPPHRFSSENLAAVVLLADRVRCECPQHLVDLIQRLSAFEIYSAECENRNIEDALLHARLNRMAGKARSMAEDALSCWLQNENIQLPGDSGDRD